MIRQFEPGDLESLKAIHKANKLPEPCLPDLDDPLILHKVILEHDSKVVMASFLRGVSEIYLLVDHGIGTPEDRWKWLQEIRDHMAEAAWSLGLDGISAWIPPEIEKSFASRLLELGYIRSPWTCYTLALNQEEIDAIQKRRSKT
jgi:hypothetical protein